MCSLAAILYIHTRNDNMNTDNINTATKILTKMDTPSISVPINIAATRILTMLDTPSISVPINITATRILTMMIRGLAKIRCVLACRLPPI